MKWVVVAVVVVTAVCAVPGLAVDKMHCVDEQLTDVCNCTNAKNQELHFHCQCTQDKPSLVLSGSSTSSITQMKELRVDSCETLELKKDLISHLPHLETVAFTRVTNLAVRKNSLHLMKHMDVIIDDVENVTVDPQAIIFKPVSNYVKVTLNFSQCTFYEFPKDSLMTDYSDLTEDEQDSPTMTVEAHNVRITCDCQKTDWFTTIDLKTTTSQSVKCTDHSSFSDWKKTCSVATRITTSVIIFLLPVLSLLRS